MPSDDTRTLTRSAVLARPSPGPVAEGMLNRDSVSFPEFRPRFPWIGADLQTIRDFLAPDLEERDPVASQVLTFPMPDRTGDRMSGSFEQPRAAVPGRPLAVLVHGLTGCADSRYVRRAAGRLLDAGYAVLRLNLRGAGPCRSVCREQYHSGRSEDLQAILEQLPPELVGNGIVMVGWSLGANVLLKGLAEFGDRFPIRAAVSVSAPIDLAAAAARLGAARNRIYHRWLLARMKQELAAAPEALEPEIEVVLAKVRNIVEFDDRFTAPRNGFSDAADYYARCSAVQFLPTIPVPTLVIHALDDPWIPADAYRDYDWAGSPSLIPLLPPVGGHVGFHAAGGRVWSDDCMIRFLNRAS